MVDTDALFDELSKSFPAANYTTFCNQMGVSYNETKSMLTRCKENYNVALRDLLSQWDQRMNGVTRKQLEDALDGAEVGGLCSIVRKHYEKDPTEEEERRIIKEAIRSGTAPWNRSRIMVIGPAGVGKTSLIRRLTGQEFNPEEKSTKGAEPNVVTNNAVSSWKLVNGTQRGKDDIMQSIAAMEPNLQSHSPCSTGEEENRNDPEITGSNRSTLGKGGMAEATIDDVLATVDADRNIAAILQGITQKEITKVKSSKLGITYSMWDFGGQEIYYITHPLFLSWRSLYILVIPLHLELGDKAPREEDAESGQEQLKGSAVRTRTILELVHFWLMSVYTHAVTDSHLEPKVLLIGTFAGDGGPGIIEEKATDKFKKLKEQLGSYPYWKQVLSPMCAIDNQLSQPSEVNKIQDRIDGLVEDSAYMKVLMPIKWRTFTTEIEDSDQNTLTVTDAHSIMKRWGINDLKEVKAVLKFYHDIGHLIYHHGYELIVLKPQILNNIVSNIITVIDDKKMEGDLAEYWRDLKEKGILSIELIKAVWKEQGGHDDQLNNIVGMMMKFDLICEIPNRPDGKRGFFVPCRSSPKLDEREIHKEDDKVEFTIDFHRFLPDGFLHRFYVRMAKWSMEKMEYIKRTFHCRQMVFDIDNGHRVVMTNDIQEGHEIKVKICAVVPFDAPPEREKATVNLNKEIIDCLHETLKNLRDLWARRIEYRVGIWCPNCAKYKRKEWIPTSLRDILNGRVEHAICVEGCRIYVGNIWRAFHTKDTTDTSRKPVSASPRPSASVNISPQSAAAAAGEVSTSKARPTEESREQNFDDLLKIVAKQIRKDTDVDDLGGKLGFKPDDITPYIEKNERNNTYMGTLDMLRKWRQRTNMSKEREQLKKVLTVLNHLRLVDEHLKDDTASPAALTTKSTNLQPEGEGIQNNPEPDSTDEDGTTRGENQSKRHVFEHESQDGPPRKRKQKTN